jgi:hypothetical protein
MQIGVKLRMEMAMMDVAASDVIVERGSVLVYRMFDVAEAFDLGMLEENARAAIGTARLRITRPGSQALIIKNAPVSVFLGEQDIVIGETRVRCGVDARVWDYGVISLRFRLPVTSMPWNELVELAATIDASSAFEDPARKHLAELLAIVAPSMQGGHAWNGTEDYVIHFIEELRGVERAAELLDKVDVAALLLGESKQPLARRTRRTIVDHAYQYWMHDLAVIDWNSALVVEPSGDRDIPDVIEFAITHLLDFRYFDDLLEEKLRTLHAEIVDTKRGFFRTNYAQLSREASVLFIDISEYIARVENSLKVIGDFYLATIFRAAVSRLRLQEWEESVTGKLQLLARVAELLSAQATARRGHALEWIVIALIAFEIVWTIARH